MRGNLNIMMSVHTHARASIIYYFEGAIDFSTTVGITRQVTVRSMTKSEKGTQITDRQQERNRNGPAISPFIGQKYQQKKEIDGKKSVFMDIFQITDY